MKTEFEYKYNEENDVFLVVEDDETGEAKCYTNEEFYDKFEVCEQCGKAVLRDYAAYTSDSDEFFCKECSYDLYYCQYTNRYFKSRYSVVYLEDRGEYCDYDYAHDNFYICEDCGDWHTEMERANNGNYYCENCIDYHNHDGYIDDYHDSDRNIKFYSLENETRDNNVHMGFELEVDYGSSYDRNDTIDNFDYLFPANYFAYEEDGSLDEGWENISQPATLNYHLSKLNDYKTMFRAIINGGFKSHNAGTCGLHIHLDKRYFGIKSELAQCKLLYLFEKHWDNLLRFSRRSDYQASRWAGKYYKEDGTIKEIVKKGWNNERYRAINLCNSDTIEIRLWRGTLNAETFEATLKFTCRLAEICKKTKALDLAKMTFEDLLGDNEVVLSYWNRVKNRNI